MVEDAGGRGTRPGYGGALSRPARQAFRAAWDHLVVEDASPPSDALFCFGSRHRRVPERAAALYARGVAPLVLVSGAAAPGEGTETEADRFAALLVAGGVPEDRIVRERRARHTGENVALGLAALRSQVEPRRLTLVSWPLAARRCRATFSLLAPEVEVASAPALARPGGRWAPTTRRARLALGELERLDRYGRSGLVAPEATPLPVRRAAAVLRTELRRTPRWSADDALAVPVPAPGPALEAEDLALLVGEG